MIARWSTDVAPYKPAWLYIADAVNDASAGRTSAEMIADYRTLIGLAKGIGARVILATAPPKDSHTTGQRDALNMVNRWIKEIQDTSVTPVDLATAVTNPVDGNWITAYHNGDGLHQSPAGAGRMGRVLEPVLASLLPVRDMFPSGPTDAANMIVNSFNAGTPGAGFPSPWQTTTTTGTPTYSTVARTDIVPGNWLEIDGTAGAVDAYAKQFRNSIGTLAPGDVVRYLVEVQVVSLTALTSLECSVFIRDSGGSTNLFQITAIGNSDTGTVDLADIPLGQTMLFRSPPVTIPAGGATMNLLNRFNGQGKVRFGRSALVKAAA
jgi:hypothetical protein